MQFTGLGIGLALMALLLLFFAVRLLVTKHWLLGWLRGMFGLTLLAVSVLAGLLAYDISTYQQIPKNKPVFTLSAQAEGAQRYRVKIFEGRHEHSFLLDGELWQLEARQLEWKSLAHLIGLEAGYRLDNIKGRFITVEQQEAARFTQIQLTESLYGIDAWQAVRYFDRDLFVIEAKPLRVKYLPLADGAVYSVSLVATGLLAKPVNKAAEQALKNWQ